MTKKKTEKTETPQTNDSPDAAAEDQLIIDVTPQKVRNGKGVAYTALILATIGTALGGFASYKLAGERGLTLATVPDYPSTMQKSYRTEFNEYQEATDSEIDSLHTLLDSISERLNALTNAQGDAANVGLAAEHGIHSQISDIHDQLAALETRLETLGENTDRNENTDANLSLEEAEALLIKLRYQRAADALIAARSQDAIAMRELVNELSTFDVDNDTLVSSVSAFMPDIPALYTKSTMKAAFILAADEALAIRVEGEGWWQQQVNQLAKLVKVRKIDADADSISAKVEAARTALDRDEIGKAITSIRSLPAPAHHYFSKWLHKAFNYNKAVSNYEALLSELRNPILSDTTQSSKDSSETSTTPQGSESSILTPSTLHQDVTLPAPNADTTAMDSAPNLANETLSLPLTSEE